MDDLILKYALHNASQFNGKANPGSVIGKVIAERPDLKSDMKGLAIRVSQIIREISSLTPSEQLEKLKKIAPQLLEKKEKEERDIFGFLGIKEGEKVITCFPPEPSKYPHIGHAKAIILNHDLARRYGGKFYLRFEDTNPELAEAHLYDVHKECYKWLGLTFDGVVIASEHMEKFYECAEKLIEKNGAYLCTCSQETTKNNRFNRIECPCRLGSLEQNQKRWNEFKTSKEGEMILRLKADMGSDNTVMRDPALMRIIDSPHPLTKTKYRMWPTYDFENSVMDGIQGTTHRLRTKEFELRNEVQRFIQRLLGFKEANIHEFARFNMEGIESSGRIIREKVKSGELLGWDDPSLTTLVALKRRGFRPAAIREFVLSTGITKNESTLTWDDLISHNKHLIDPISDRYFFIEDPIKIKIEGAEAQMVHLKRHPQNPERGVREMEVGSEFYITRKDSEEIQSDGLYRFMDCLNFRVENKVQKFHSLDYETFKKEGKKIMHYLPIIEGLASVEILMPDKKIIKGLAEPMVNDLKVDDIIQFERFGFVRLDTKEDGVLKFWFAHK